MRVLVTGSYGRCGTALIDHLADDSDYEFTYLDRSNPADGHPYGGFDTVVAEVGAEDDQGTIRDAMAGQDAIVHLAAYPHVESTWTDVHGPNVEGTNAVLSAASDAGVESVVFASTNHVQGGLRGRARAGAVRTGLRARARPGRSGPARLLLRDEQGVRRGPRPVLRREPRVPPTVLRVANLQCPSTAVRPPLR